jgi:hypothetical protein
MKLNTERTNRCKVHFNELILDDLSNFKVWVAGGAVRSWYSNEKISDIDLFFPNESERQKCLNFITGLGGITVYSNKNVDKVKYKNKIFDFCKVYFSDPESTINSFDFTVTMASVDKSDSYFGDSFFIDLASKRLAINTLPMPVSTIMRLQKYIRRRYWICKEEMSKIVFAIQGIDLTQFINQNGQVEIPQDSDSGMFAGMD